MDIYIHTTHGRANIVVFILCSYSTELCGTIPSEVQAMSGGNKFSITASTNIGTACGIPSPQPTPLPSFEPTSRKQHPSPLLLPFVVEDYSCNVLTFVQMFVTVPTPLPSPHPTGAPTLPPSPLPTVIPTPHPTGSPTWLPSPCKCNLDNLSRA